jgi:hypothetical protein
MQEVHGDPAQEDSVKKEKEGEEDDSEDEDGTDQESVISTSEIDEGASTVDEAELREQQVRRTLLFALLSALGIVALGNLLSRWIGRCFRGSNDTGEAAADLAGETAGDAVGATVMPGGGAEQAMAATNVAAGQAQ